MSRVVVVGSVNLDAVMHVGRLPAAGETVIGAELAEHDRFSGFGGFALHGLEADLGPIGGGV